MPQGAAVLASLRRGPQPRCAAHRGAAGSNRRRPGLGEGGKEGEVRAPPPSPSLPLIPVPSPTQAASPRQPASAPRAARAPPRRPSSPPQRRHGRAPALCLTRRHHTGGARQPVARGEGGAGRSCGGAEGDIGHCCPRKRGSAEGRAVLPSRRLRGQLACGPAVGPPAPAARRDM